MNIENIGQTSTSKDVVSLREAALMLGHKSTDMTTILCEQGALEYAGGDATWITYSSLMSYISERYSKYIEDSGEPTRKSLLRKLDSWHDFLCTHELLTQDEVEQLFGANAIKHTKWIVKVECNGQITYPKFIFTPTFQNDSRYVSVVNMFEEYNLVAHGVTELALLYTINAVCGK